VAGKGEREGEGEGVTGNGKSDKMI
jgi:hypothetical protein